MDITKARREDLAEILELQYLAFQSEAVLAGKPDIPPLTQTLDQLREEHRVGVVLKAVEDDRILGSVRVKLQNGTAHIGKLIVHPDRQKQGLGTSLLQAAQEVYSGCRCELFTGAASKSNLEFYRRRGFREFTRREVAPGLVYVFMEKHPEL